MGHIYFELPEIPVPTEAKSAGNRVYISVDIGAGITQRQYIGVWAKKNYTFYPNEVFRHYYPDLWVKHYGKENEYNYVYGVGLYAVNLILSHNMNLYQTIYQIFGPLYGNALMDYAMYSMKERMNISYLFKPCMEEEFIFSKDRNDEDWLGDVFNNKISNNMIYRFKLMWATHCKNDLGVSKVWIATDGSNSDNQVEQSKYSKRGKAKSHKNVNIISYIWAVNISDGLPITFFVNDGGTADSKAFTEICSFLELVGIEIEGYILDRGFLTHEVLLHITETGNDYLVKLKSDTYSHVQMLNKYASEIQWKASYLVGYGGVYGVSEGPQKIFSSYNDMAYIGLFFDGKNGPERRITLSDKIFEAIDAAQKDIAEGRKPIISKEMSHFLNVEEVSHEENQTDDDTQDKKSNDENVQDVNDCGPKYKLVIIDKACSKRILSKGFDSIACSKNIGAREMHELYSLRDVSEKQFMICKSMLGNNVFHSHNEKGTVTRELVCFIASIIRNKFVNTCHSLSIKPCRIMEELSDKAYAIRRPNGVYQFIDKRPENMKKLCDELGLTKKDFETIVTDMTFRLSAKEQNRTVSQYHLTPENTRKYYELLAQKKPIPPEFLGVPVSDAQTDKKEKSQDTQHKEEPGDKSPPENEGIKFSQPKKRGRPLGRKNNKTIEREQREKAEHDEGKVKRKRGRQLGSKNKKTLEKEAANKLNPPTPKKRGRKKGTKDSKPRVRRTKAQIEEAKKMQNSV